LSIGILINICTKLNICASISPPSQSPKTLVASLHEHLRKPIFMKLFIHKLFKTNKLRTAYHEAGHFIVASIFQKTFKLNKISINKKLLRLDNLEFNGGLNLEFIEQPNQTDFEKGDQLILVNLAGICAQTIHTKGQKYVRKNIHNFKNNTDLLNLTGSKEDYNLAQKYSKPIGQYLNVNYTYVEWSAFLWLFKLFLNPIIWNCIKKTAEMLITVKDYTLDSNQISHLLQEIDLNPSIDKIKTDFINKRYPLSKNKLIT
jgi:hypothetical protein